MRHTSTQPLAIDLFCGLGGWTEGLLAEGYDVIGFDIERHVYGEHAYPAQLVLQDILTLHGSQFRSASLIVASPPCQEFSYMAMPWSKAKAKERDLLEGRDDPKRLTALFDACFRIQSEACEAAGRHIPLVVENVRGAQKWVGRSRWNFGSFHLWGDVPALMPIAKSFKVPGFRFDGNGGSFQTASAELAGRKVPGVSFTRGAPGHGVGFNVMAQRRAVAAIKNTGGSWFAVAHNKTSGAGNNPRAGKTRNDRKLGSALIAKIPFELSRYIAQTYKPRIEVAA